MALSRTLFAVDSLHGVNQTAAFTTASHALPAQSITVIIASAYATQVPAVRPSNFVLTNSAGLAMTAVGNTGSPVQWGYGTRVWYVENTTGSPISTTFSLTGGTDNLGCWDVQVISYTGYDTTAKITGFVAGTSASGTGAASVTLSATPTSSDEVIGSLAGVATAAGTYTVGEGAGFTRAFLATDTTTECYTEAQYATQTSTTVPWTSAGASGTALEAMLCAFIVKGTAGGITGTTAATQALNSAAASGAVSVSGAESATQAKNAAAAAGTAGSGVLGTAAPTQAMSSSAAAGAVSISGSAAAVNRNAGAAAASSSITGAVAGAQAVSTASAAGSVFTPSAVTFTLKQYWLKPWQTTPQATLQSGSNPMTVTAGSTLMAVSAGWDSDRQIPLVTDSAGSFSVASDGTTSALSAPDQITLSVALQNNAAGGSHTITVPDILEGSPPGFTGEIGVWIYEVSGLHAAPNVRDVTAVHRLSSAKTWTGTTGTTPQVGDVVVAVGTMENSVEVATSGTTTPPGYTQLGINDDGSKFIPTVIAYKQVTTAGTQTAGFQVTDNNKTEDFAVMVTLVPSASAGSVTGSVAAQQAGNSAAAAGGSSISGAAAAIQGKNAAAAAAQGLIAAASAATQALNTASAAGGVGISGSLARSQAANVASAGGTAAVGGVGAGVQAGNTASAAGNVAASGTVAGSGAASQAANAGASVGAVLVAGAVSAAQVSNPVAASGTTTVAGAAAPVQAANAASITGNVAAAGVVSGSAASVQAPGVAAAIGAVVARATAAAIQAKTTSAAAGAVVTPGAFVSGNDAVWTVPARRTVAQIPARQIVAQATTD